MADSKIETETEKPKTPIKGLRFYEMNDDGTTGDKAPFASPTMTPSSSDSDLVKGLAGSDLSDSLSGKVSDSASLYKLR